MVAAVLDLTEITCQVLRGEREYVASHAGRSQYSAGGMSACGLAAVNCARVILQKEKRGLLKGAGLIKRMMQRETCEDVLDICLQWSSPAHLDVDEITSAPIFDKTLNLVWSEYDRPSFEQFEALLNRMKGSTNGSAALVITRPPEIVSILKIVTEDESKPVFVTFDSHPRHKHPQGAAFIFHRSLDAAATYLAELLQYDPNLLSDPALQWQAQLLAHYSAHMFVAKDFNIGRGLPPLPSKGLSLDVEQLLVDASLDVLRLKAEIAELRDRNRTLESDVTHHTSENARLELRIEDLEESNRQLKRNLSAIAAQSRAVPKNAVAGTSSSSSSSLMVAKPPYGKQSPFSESPRGSSPATPSSLNHTPVPASTTPSPSKGKIVCRFEDEMDDDNELFATRIQLEWLDEAERHDDSLTLALQEHKRFEEEDRRLREQLQELQGMTQVTFECGVCMDTLPEDVVARVDGCEHCFCRSCLLQYLQSKLTEHRFPILCPMCTADRGSGDPGTISGVLAMQIGLTEPEYAIFTELELASFSILLHCRRCQQAVFVDKSEYEAQEIIACPLPGCTHAWCKACSRSIEFNGPRHSCDGSNELNHLMNQQGWKACPGCRTPTSKIDGCNHMTCITPGCNTHFCYRCGDTIVQSVLRRDIQNALGRHYARCQMIEVPPELERRRR